jgi:DNA-binding response OmpR family regulator
MRHCLVVDQDRLDSAELSRLIGRFGFATSESRNADDALRSCQRQTPDLVVVSGALDEAAMPDLVKRLRRAGQGRPPVVLVYSREPDAEKLGRMIVQGAAECLMKPVDSDMLAFKLKQVGLI